MSQRFSNGQRRLAAAAAACIWVVAALPAPASARDVWFQPLDNLTPRGSYYVDPDFPALFTGDGAWAEGVSTFAINSVYAILATDADLKTMGAFLAAHGIALNVDLPMLVMANPPAVGRPNVCLYIAQRLKGLGIAVASFSADEPLTWGHYYSGPGGVQYSVADAATAFASGIAEVHQVFPKAPIVDYEAPSLTTAAQFAADLPTWLAAVKADSGSALSMLVFDADWPGDWKAAVKASQPALNRAHVKSGIFITDNNVADLDPETWFVTALENEGAVEGSGLQFSTKILANWTGAQTVLLPQTGLFPITDLLPQIEAGQGVK